MATKPKLREWKCPHINEWYVSSNVTCVYSVRIHGGSAARSGIGEPFRYSWIWDCELWLRRSKSSRLNRSKLICDRWFIFVKLPADESLWYGDVFDAFDDASFWTSKLSKLFCRWCLIIFFGIDGRSTELGAFSTMVTVGLPWSGGCLARNSLCSLCRSMATVRSCCTIDGSRPSFTGGNSYSYSSFSPLSERSRWYDSKLIFGRLPGFFSLTGMLTLLSTFFPLNVSYRFERASFDLLMPSAARLEPEMVSYFCGERSFLPYSYRLFISGGELVKSRLNRRPIESMRSPRMLSVLNRLGVNTDELERDRPSFFRAENMLGFGLARGLNRDGGLFTLSFCGSASATTAKFWRSTCCALNWEKKRTKTPTFSLKLPQKCVAQVCRVKLNHRFTFESPESFRRIEPCSYGDGAVHPPSGTRFDYEFGRKIAVFATNLLATLRLIALL